MRASALAKKFSDDGPHLMDLPERTFEIERLLADVKAVHERDRQRAIAVSEGNCCPLRRWPASRG
jgi:6-phosphofructokinase 1